MSVGRVDEIGFSQVCNNIQLLQIYKIVYNKECLEIKKMANKPAGMLHRLANIELQKKFNILPSILLADGIKTLL
jgi:hypothetical protein